jgi:ribosome maturation factor RimP
LFLERERSSDELKFFAGISNLLSSSKLDIYDLEYNRAGKTVRLFIIDPETDTATIDDCVEVDRILTPYFEESDWIPEDIILEVSSPGATRSLHREIDFKNAIGKKVKCTFVKKISEEMFPVDDKRILGQKKIIGKLLDVNPEAIEVEFFENSYTVSFEYLKQVNIELDI